MDGVIKYRHYILAYAVIYNIYLLTHLRPETVTTAIRQKEAKHKTVGLYTNHGSRCA